MSYATKWWSGMELAVVKRKPYSNESHLYDAYFFE